MNIPAKIITVDGPSGAGKGTVSIQLADKLGWHFLDSGLMYRALAWYCLHHKIETDDFVKVRAAIGSYELCFVRNHVYIDDVDVTNELRTESCGNCASTIAVDQEVRTGLLASQRSFKKAPGLVADGRDMGTNVFPDADLKIYLHASAKERAMRRYLQLKKTNLDVKLADLENEVAKRDARDMERAAAPLRPATDAIVIDSSHMTIEDVVSKVLSQVEAL